MTGCGGGQNSQVSGDKGQAGPLPSIMPFSSASALFLPHLSLPALFTCHPFILVMCCYCFVCLFVFISLIFPIYQAFYPG